jgi:hypothetical protein
VAASFRVSRGGGETHEVINQSATPSHFLRIEFKTDPAGTSPFYRETMKTYPAATNTTDVKFESAQMRITRLVVAPGQSLDLSAAARQPALVVALKDGTLAGVQPGAAAAIAAGQERWLDAGQQTRLTNAGSAPAELLRIDFLTGARR